MLAHINAVGGSPQFNMAVASKVGQVEKDQM
jgi:hypothetical protein